MEQLRTPFIPGAPNASWPTAYAAVWASNKGREVPQGFLATSHEWKRMTDYGGENVQAFANIFKMLAAKPVLRIGGSSQDLMTELPGPEVWAALVRLHQATNCRWESCPGSSDGATPSDIRLPCMLLTLQGCFLWYLGCLQADRPGGNQT